MFEADESGFILDKDTPAPYLQTYYLMTYVSPPCPNSCMTESASAGDPSCYLVCYQAPFFRG